MLIIKNKNFKNFFLLFLIIVSLIILLFLIGKPIFFMGWAARRGTCGAKCSNNYQCLPGYFCYNGVCRNNDCPENIGCRCFAPAPLPTRQLPTQRPTSTPPAVLPTLVPCNIQCTSDFQCQTYYCHRQLKVCRKINCPEEPNCVCLTPSPRPITPALTISPKPTTVPYIRY